MRFFDRIPAIGRITSSTRKRLTLVFGLTIPLGGVLADMFVTGSNHVVDGGRLCKYQPYVAPKEVAK